MQAPSQKHRGAGVTMRHQRALLTLGIIMFGAGSQLIVPTLGQGKGSTSGPASRCPENDYVCELISLYTTGMLTYTSLSNMSQSLATTWQKSLGLHASLSMLTQRVEGEAQSASEVRVGVSRNLSSRRRRRSPSIASLPPHHHHLTLSPLSSPAFTSYRSPPHRCKA